MTTLSELKDNYALGKKVFESVSIESRVDWGSSLLVVLVKSLEEIPEAVSDLIIIMDTPDLWKNAHDQFQKIRAFASENEDFEPHSFIVLAEKMAKITYNASGEPAPFDSTSGYYIGPLLQEIADFIGDLALSEEIERVLFPAG